MKSGLLCLGFWISFPNGAQLREKHTLIVCHRGMHLSVCLGVFLLNYSTANSLQKLNRYEKEGKPSELADIDVFVSTVDPMKEPPLITANTVLSILAVDYPVEKVSCYVSDDGAAMLTFEAISETSEFARNFTSWFQCWQREYEEFKVRINALVAMAQKVPEDGWTMQDGTPWPGNSVRDHPGMIQVSTILV